MGIGNPSSLDDVSLDPSLIPSSLLSLSPIPSSVSVESPSSCKNQQPGPLCGSEKKKYLCEVCNPPHSQKDQQAQTMNRATGQEGEKVPVSSLKIDKFMRIPPLD